MQILFRKIQCAWRVLYSRRSGFPAVNRLYATGERFEVQVRRMLDQPSWYLQRISQTIQSKAARDSDKIDACLQNTSSAFEFMKTNWVLHERSVSGIFFSVRSFAIYPR